MKSLYETLGLEAPASTPEGPAYPVPKSLDAALTATTGEAFAKAIVESPEYRASIVRRVLLDELAPAVECRILDHAYGQPVKRLEVKDKSNEFESFTPEQLEARASTLLGFARALRRTNDEASRSPLSNDEDPAPSFVH